MRARIRTERLLLLRSPLALTAPPRCRASETPRPRDAAAIHAGARALVAAAGLLELNQIRRLGCQTDGQSNFDPQRFSAVMSNFWPSLRDPQDIGHDTRR